jgi:hypothetical protein
LPPQFFAPLTSGYNGAGYAKRPTPSPDGRTAMVTTASQFGGFLTDILLLDLPTGTLRVVDSQPLNLQASEVFTADSRFGLYGGNCDFNVGLSALFATDLQGRARQVSDDSTMLFNFAAGVKCTGWKWTNASFASGATVFVRIPYKRWLRSLG